MALFNLPTQQLRENFVRHRLGESQHFQRNDIEDWLQGQRNSPQPDDLWVEFPKIMVETGPSLTGRGSQILQDYADPAGEFSPGFQTSSHEIGDDREAATSAYRERLKPLLDALHAGGVPLYWPTMDGPLVVATPKTGEPICQMFELEDDEPDFWGEWCIRLRRAYHVDLMAVLVQTWRSGSAKMAAARQFLCDRLAGAIAKVRAAAAADFDRAIAVSADGTQIVHADWVVLPSGYDLDAELLPAHLFRDSKILRQRLIAHRAITGTTETIPLYQGYWINESLRLLANCTGEQALIKVTPSLRELMNTGGKCQPARIFVTPRQYCPQPLPRA